jgi:hypothetical protein
VLEDSFVVASFQVFAVTPSVLFQSRALDFGAACATEGVNALVHSHIVLVYLADKFDGHGGILGKVLRNESGIRSAIVARRLALRGIECFTKVSEYLSASTVGFVLAVLDHGPQHVA